MAFISYRQRLAKVLTGAARGKKGSKGGGVRVRISNVHTERLAVGMIGGGIREIVNDTDRPSFLERELTGLGLDGYR